MNWIHRVDSMYWRTDGRTNRFIWWICSVFGFFWILCNHRTWKRAKQAEKRWVFSTCQRKIFNRISMWIWKEPMENICRSGVTRNSSLVSITIKISNSDCQVRWWTTFNTTCLISNPLKFVGNSQCWFAEASPLARPWASISSSAEAVQVWSTSKSISLIFESVKRHATNQTTHKQCVCILKPIAHTLTPPPTTTSIWY